MNRTLPFLAALLALPASASAQLLDAAEEDYGVSAVSAMTGNGGLTAGVSDRGELTVLSWPSPSFHDQVDHQTVNGPSVRDHDRFGAAEDRGVFAGLWIEPADGAPFISWLRDPEWEHSQSYRSDASAAIEQSARLPGTGLSVFETTFVDPSTDVLHRRATIQRDATSTVQNVRYLLFTNFAPHLDRPAELTDRPAFPPPDADDDRHDFAAFWDDAQGALVHFAPAARDLTVLSDLMAGDWTDESWAAEGLGIARGIADASGPGVFLTLTASDAPDSVQVGWDTTRPCDGTAAWTWRPGTAWDDAQDGTLSGSPLGACQADATLAWDVDLGAPGTLATVSLDQTLSAAGTSGASRALATDASGSFDRALTDADAAWGDWLAELHVPTTLGDDLQGAAQRALISIAQGTDRDSGAIVASIARQPGEHLDRPAVSPWLDLALDISGDFDSVSRHSRFLASVQNRAPELGEDGTSVLSPAGAWLGGFWADGQPASRELDAFSLESVGLTVWALTAHAAFAANDEVRRDALGSAWPAIRRGADLLAGCVADGHPALDGASPAEGEPGWYPAWQDVVAGDFPSDEQRLASGSQDAESFLTCAPDARATWSARQGLLAAADAARILCVDGARSDYWESRAHELGAASLLTDYVFGTWQEEPAGVLWPTPFWIDDAHADLFGGVEAADDFLEQALLDAAEELHLGVEADVALTTAGSATAGRNTLALAGFWRGERRPDADVWVENLTHLERLAVDFAQPGTGHLGAVFVSLDTDGDGAADSAEQRVATPHLGAAALTYLTAMAIAHPERFDALDLSALDPVCPVGEQPVLSRRAADCEGCESNASGSEGSILLLGLLALFRRRRS